MRKKDVFFRTKRNITIVSTGIIFLCLAIFVIITEIFYQSKLFERVDQQLLTHKNMVLMSQSIIKRKGDEQEVILPAPISPNIISFAWEDGKVVDESPHPYLGKNKYPIYPQQYNGEVVTLQDGGYTYRAITFKKDELKIDLLLNVDSELNAVKQLQRGMMIGLVILVLIAWGLSAYLAEVVLKPIRLAYNQQVFFVQDASHEMRTPLAVLKGKLELLCGYRQDKIEGHLELIAQMMTEIKGLEKLNKDLLLLSKEGIEVQLNLTTFKLGELMEELEEVYGDLAELQDKYFYLEQSILDKEVTWDRTQVKRCLIILLENALKYTHEGDHISVLIQENYKVIRISVKDSGIGIKPEDQDRIFDRFFRSNEVRGKNIEGSGIGLSVLKVLANQLGIKVHMSSVYGEGTWFILELPEVMS